MEFESSIGSSIGIDTSFSSASVAAPSISAGSFNMPGFAIENTISGIDLGGSFKPDFSFTNTEPLAFGNSSVAEPSIPDVFYEGLTDINLDPLTDVSLPILGVPSVHLSGDQELSPISIDPEAQTAVIEQTEIGEELEGKEGLEVLETQVLEFAKIAELAQETETFIQALEITEAKPLIQGEIDTKTSGLNSDFKDLKEDKIKEAYKFVVDEEALASRNMALKQAVEKAVFVDKQGNELVNSKVVAANMPTESESPDVMSQILPRFVIEILGLEKGDGSYRPFVDAISGFGIVAPESILDSGQKINNELPPVAVKSSGREVGEKDVARVYEFKREPIRPLRSALSSR